MQVRRLDQVNIQTTQVETMVVWYRDILCLRADPRPAFSFPGAWLFAGRDAVIHLVGHAAKTLWVLPPSKEGLSKILRRCYLSV